MDPYYQWSLIVAHKTSLNQRLDTGLDPTDILEGCDERDDPTDVSEIQPLFGAILTNQRQATLCRYQFAHPIGLNTSLLDNLSEVARQRFRRSTTRSFAQEFGLA